jgi:hypothetical protein
VATADVPALLWLAMDGERHRSGVVDGECLRIDFMITTGVLGAFGDCDVDAWLDAAGLLVSSQFACVVVVVGVSKLLLGTFEQPFILSPHFSAI